MTWTAPVARCSERGAVYADALARLLDGGAAYRDFGGDANWRDADPAEAAARADNGEPYAVRFRVPRPPEPVPREARDVVRGALRWADARKSLPEDFVLARRDGAPLYVLCASADDAAMGVTHVVRGEEHISNTLAQTLVLEALGAAAPTYAHCSLVVDDRGQKLSKRTAGAAADGYGAATVAALREAGCTPLGLAA